MTPMLKTAKATATAPAIVVSMENFIMVNLSVMHFGRRLLEEAPAIRRQN